MHATFSITREGINIPYRTFLADSASGLVLILFVLACYRFRIVTSAPLRDLVLDVGAPAFGSEVKVFVLFALFLLATPLVFALNAISWLLLDQTIDTIEQCCSRVRGDAIYSVGSINAARHVETVTRCLGAEGESFTATGWFFASSSKRRSWRPSPPTPTHAV